jgi:hypothetical protein
MKLRPKLSVLCFPDSRDFFWLLFSVDDDAGGLGVCEDLAEAYDEF